MSGTSLDGIDAALVETDGETVGRFGPALTVPYDPALRQRLRSVLGGRGDLDGVARDVTLAHGAAVRRLLGEAGIGAGEVAVVGFHGHTVLHRPADGRTVQIGDGALLAALTGIDVVADFRSADVRAGGQGAPFLPLYHAALAREADQPVAVLNIGGVANVTWIAGGIGPSGILAFDTGPGNALLDDWALAQTGRPVDEDGKLAGAGRVSEPALARLLEHPYFSAPPPKSLDRDDFSPAPVAGLSAADGAATLAAFTAQAVVRAGVHFPAPPGRWLVCGGGRHNPVLMGLLRDLLRVPVEPVEAAGWQGDVLEAQGFAFLAQRSLRGLPLSLPSTTGVPAPQTGGILFRRPSP